MKPQLDEMLKVALSDEKRIEKKVAKLDLSAATVRDLENLIGFLSNLRCERERISTIYEVRGKLGI